MPEKNLLELQWLFILSLPIFIEVSSILCPSWECVSPQSVKHIVLKVSFIYCSWKMLKSSKTIHLFVTKEMTSVTNIQFP